jgi:hypothetical protein
MQVHRLRAVNNTVQQTQRLGYQQQKRNSDNEERCPRPSLVRQWLPGCHKYRLPTQAT